MKKKILKILIVAVLFFIIVNIYLSVHNKVLALSNPAEVPPEFWISGNKDVGEEELALKAAPVLGVIRIFGFMASIITLAIIGIKIMYGSVEEKASYKQTLLPWAIGAVMLFTMTTIPSIVFNIIGKENMEEEMVLSGPEGKIYSEYCLNGKRIMGTNGSGTFYHEGGTKCTNNEKIKNDENYKYRCKKCDGRLEKIGKYYWCSACKIGYK